MPHDYDRRKTARDPMSSLWDMTPKYKRILDAVARDSRGGNPKITSALTSAAKKFNEVIDLLRVADYEEEQELKER